MPPYYHAAEHWEIEKILQEGLKPGIELGRQNHHNGRLNNNKYVYLAKDFSNFQNGLFSDIVDDPRYGFLKIDLPPEHPVERDFDISVVIRGQGFFGVAAFVDIYTRLGFKDVTEILELVPTKSRQRYDIYYNQAIKKAEKGSKTALLPLKMSLANDGAVLRNLFSSVSDETWDEAIGFYRTPKAIPLNGKYKVERYIPSALAI